MFDLNPLQLPQAWWQHLIILIVPAVIGYIIAHRNGIKVLSVIKDSIIKTHADLDKCSAELVSLKASSGDDSPEDLKVIEGIGPKIEKVLRNAGIQTYSDLAQLTSAGIRQILDAAGKSFQLHDPATWPDQAKLAAAGRWQDLHEWQKELDGGRE